MKSFFKDLSDLIAHGDMRLPCVYLGLGLILWGVIGLLFHPEEVVRAANRFALGDGAMSWAFNYVAVGVMYIYVGVRNFPHPQSLLLGIYSSMVWTMVAIARPSSTFTSGVALNLIVVLLGIILIYRSGRR